MVHRIRESTLTFVRRRAVDLSSGLRYAYAAPKLILVMGMHRSGTSCVSRIINMMGADLGPVRGDEQAAPDEEIHWESSEVNWMNEQMLERSGHSWRNPPSEIQVSNRDLWRCRRALWDLAGSSVASIKDPRMLITYPIWQRVLPEHGVIACLRHPFNVAKSLNRRDRMSIDEGLELWFIYNQRLREIVDRSRQVSWFNFDAGESSAYRLIDEVAAHYPLARTPEALSHFTAAEQHHTGTGALPERIGLLYEDLLSRARS